MLLRGLKSNIAINIAVILLVGMLLIEWFVYLRKVRI